MRTINKLKYMAGLLMALVVTACSEDSIDVPEASVKLVTAPEMIGATGGSTTATINQAVSETYTPQDWLTVTANGNQVEIKAEANTDHESRKAKLVIKSSPADSIIVAVAQSGLVFAINSETVINASNVESTHLISFEANSEVEILASPDWAELSFVEDGISCILKENATGKARIGEIVLGCGSYNQSVKVTQLDIEENIFGNYALVQLDENGEIKDYWPCVLSADGLDFAPVELGAIPGTFDPDSFTLTIGNADYLGSAGGFHVFSLLVASNNSISLGTTPKASITFEPDSEGNVTGIISGNWGNGLETIGIQMSAFADSEGTDYKGGFLFGTIFIRL